jgi:hypothetical protein
MARIGLQGCSVFQGLHRNKNEWKKHRCTKAWMASGQCVCEAVMYTMVLEVAKACKAVSSGSTMSVRYSKSLPGKGYVLLS